MDKNRTDPIFLNGTVCFHALVSLIVMHSCSWLHLKWSSYSPQWVYIIIWNKKGEYISKSVNWFKVILAQLSMADFLFTSTAWCCTHAFISILTSVSSCHFLHESHLFIWGWTKKIHTHFESCFYQSENYLSLCLISWLWHTFNCSLFSLILLYNDRRSAFGLVKLIQYHRKYSLTDCTGLKEVIPSMLIVS